jgi:hypothetical protein
MALGKRQEARVKRVWAILLFFTQIGFIVFTYLIAKVGSSRLEDFYFKKINYGI